MKLFLGVLLLMGLAVGCSGNSNNAVATPASTAAAPAATPETLTMTPEQEAMALAQKGKKWGRSEQETGGDKVVGFEMYPIDDDQSDPLRDRPRIGVLCDGHGMDIYFRGGDLKDGKFKIKFDEGPVLTQTWALTGHTWLPASAQKKLIFKGLASAKAAKLEYNPADKGHEVVTFNMADYRESVLTDPMCRK